MTETPIETWDRKRSATLASAGLPDDGAMRSAVCDIAEGRDPIGSIRSALSTVDLAEAVADYESCVASLTSDLADLRESGASTATEDLARAIVRAGTDRVAKVLAGGARRDLLRRAANLLLGLGLSKHTNAIPAAQIEATDLAAELRADYLDSEPGRVVAPERDRQLTAIAHVRLGVPDLRTKGADALDFHECHVASLQRALTEAFEAGRKAGPS